MPRKPIKPQPAGAALGLPAVPDPIKKRRANGQQAPHEPTDLTRKTVALGSFIGYTQEQIARLIEVDVKTLLKYYDDELTRGAEKIGAAVAGNLVNIATQQQDRKAALTACIFIAKTRLGMRERDPFSAEAEAKIKKAEDGEETVTVSLKIGDREAPDA